VLESESLMAHYLFFFAHFAAGELSGVVLSPKVLLNKRTVKQNFYSIP